MCKTTYKWLATCLLIGMGMAGAPWALAANATHAAGQPATDTSAQPPAQTQATHTGPLSIEQAVAQVQRKTHGKVLRTNSRRYGDVTEYWIKVLTPDGRVRVISLRSQPIQAPGGKAQESH